MRELIALAAAFLIIIAMIYKKVHIGTTMLTATIVMGFIAGFTPLEVLTTILKSILERPAVELFAVIAVICILSSVLQKYGVLDKMADSLEDLFNNNKISMMFLPLLVGVLSIPGGAVMSAPVVDSVGDKLGIDNARKAAINVVFRHIAFFLFPFSTTMILASQIGGVSPYTIIKYNIPVALVSIIASYMLFMRNGISEAEDPVNKAEKGIVEKIGSVLIYTSPLWVGIVTNVAFGMPFYLALLPGVAIVYFLIDKGKQGFIREMFKGINWSMVYAVAGIMCFQGFIKQMPAISQSINNLMASGMDMRVLVMLSTAVMGLLTGNCNAVIGMFLPLFITFAADTGDKAYITSLIYGFAFIFYFISPMHLCQVFTAEYFNVGIKELYGQYKIYWLVLLMATIILYMFIY